MGKWMSAVLMVAVAGCGLEPVEQREAPGGEPTTVREERYPSRVLPSIAVQPQRPEHPAPVAVRQPVEPKPVDVTVKLTQVAGAEGKQLQLVLGMMGCGFSTLATGSATIDRGAAEVTLPGLPANLEQVDALVFSDVDGDGQCTAADTVWQTTLSTNSFRSQVVTVDLSKLEIAAEWTCFAFNH